MSFDPAIASVAVPVLAALWAILWPRLGGTVAIAATSILLLTAIQALFHVMEHGAIRHALGAWPGGLAIVVRFDALAAPFMLLNSLVGLAGSVYATAYFSATDARRFWAQWLLLLGALNGLLLSADLFNLYVTLELIGLTAVGLAALGKGTDALRAALRYLAVGLTASMLYLAGVALFYLNHGTLDLAVLATRLDGSALDMLAIGLISSGLMMKAALFPLHAWLPSTHASAPAPVSAALSALVVKAAWYLMLRLWLEVFEPGISDTVERLLTVLAAAGVLWGSWHALKAPRLKLVAAYSSISQISYLFLAIPLLLATPEGELRQTLLAAVVVFALGHGLAKAALFLGAGIMIQKAGHDDIERLGGTVQALPATAFTIALAGVALIGLPPSAAFLGKWHLMEAAFHQDLGWIVLVLVLGSLLAGAYVFRFISHCFGHDDAAPKRVTEAREEWPALLLATAATVILGLGAAPIWTLLGAAS